MKGACTSLCFALSGTAAAQTSGWSLAVSPYAWVPGITASVDTAWGTVEVDKSSSDVLSKFDVAFMAAFEARNGRWGLIADLFYADLSQSRATPLGLLSSQARFEIEAKALTTYPAYRIHEAQRTSIDLMAGLRVNLWF